MRRSLVLMAVCLALAAGFVNAQETPRRALAEELMNLINMRENMEKVYAMLKQMIPAQMERTAQATGQPGVPANASPRMEKMMALITQELSWDKLKDDYITIYADTFTDEELKGIIAFYKSPVGQAFIQKQPELMKRSMEVTQKVMIQLMPKIQAIMKEEVAPAPVPAPPKKDAK